MSILSYYCRNKLLGCLLGKDTFEKPTIYMGLSTAAPTDPPGTSVDPGGPDYNRVEVSNWFVDQVERTVYNNSTIEFYTKSDWGIIRDFTLWDSQVGGNLLGYGELQLPVTAIAGKVLSISKKNLLLSIEPGTITDYLSYMFLEHLFGNIELQPITKCYIGLSHTDPGDAGIVSVPSNPEYKNVSFNDWGITSLSEMINLSGILFADPISSWGNIPYIFLKDGEDRVLLYSALSYTVTPVPHNPVNLIASSIIFIFD